MESINSKAIEIITKVMGENVDEMCDVWRKLAGNEDDETFCRHLEGKLQEFLVGIVKQIGKKCGVLETKIAGLLLIS
jgi:hypothetical protein